MMSFDDDNLSSPDSAPQPADPTQPHGSSFLDNSSAAPEGQVPAGLILPEDINPPWGWSELFFLVAFAIGGTFVMATILTMVFWLFGVNPAHIQKSASEKSLFVILNQTLLSVALLVYLAAQMRLRSKAPFWRTIGWRPLETGKAPAALAYLSFILGGFLFSLLVELASGAFRTKAKMPIETFFQDRRSALFLMLMGVLLAPVVEETIFRGFIYPVLARTFGVGAGVVVTGALFGLLHAPQLWGGWAQITLLIVVGIVFTYVRAFTRTVVASYLMHVSYNSFLFLAFLYVSHGLRQLPAGS
jgi:uncharacterized protein